MLAWLHPDREQAGLQYEEIRRNIIKLFRWRGCADAETLADETINRVTQKLQELKGYYVGSPALYFYGVAKKVLLEQLKKEHQVPQAPMNDRVAAYNDPSDELFYLYEALDKCMGALPEDDRKLILEYYAYVKVEKIKHRKDMAKQLNLTPDALRKRVQRIREHLRRDIEEVLGKNVRRFRR